VVNIPVASEDYPDLFCAAKQTQSQQNQARLGQGDKHATLHHCSRALAGLAVTDGPSQPQPPSQTHPKRLGINPIVKRCGTNPALRYLVLPIIIGKLIFDPE
jgi:hypothetical protein